MAVGQIEESVTVQANALTVETRNMGVGQVMDNKRILDLPLNGRNPADLMQFLPAAVPQPALNATSRSMGGSNGGQAYSLAGGLSFGVSFVLDGADAQQPVRQPQPAAAVSRRARRIQGRNERADRAERHAFRAAPSTS